MKDMFSSHDDAVSPVVGVMLMLVVTIIIAAVVSGFAGGLSGGTQKAPQVTLKTEAYNGTYILVEHLGGDPIATDSITVRTFIPSGTYNDMNYEIEKWGNQTYCPTNDRVDGEAIDPMWGPSYNWVVFQPGDQIKINWEDAFAQSMYGIMAPGIGEQLNVEIYDMSSGKLVVSSQTIVLP